LSTTTWPLEHSEGDGGEPTASFLSRALSNIPVSATGLLVAWGTDTVASSTTTDHVAHFGGGVCGVWLGCALTIRTWRSGSLKIKTLRKKLRTAWRNLTREEGDPRLGANHPIYVSPADAVRDEADESDDGHQYRR
jgi:hypothetical protein